MDRNLLDRAPASLMSKNPKQVRGDQLAAEALEAAHENLSLLHLSLAMKHEARLPEHGSQERR